MKKNLFLDLGNVIVTVKSDIAIKEIAKLCNAEPEDIHRSIDWTLEKNYESGQISTEEYLQRINEIHPGTNKIEFKDFCGAWAHGFEAIATTIDLLPKLAEKTNLFMLSNTNEIHFTAIENRFDIAKYFQKTFLSYELGTRKPNDDIYLKALEFSKSEAEDSYFVDDLEENILAASKLGITTHQYQNHQNFYKFLSENSLI